MTKKQKTWLENLIERLKGLFFRTSNQGRASGIIKFFDRKKRFGFIISGSQEYFFHVAATKPKDFKALQDGATVKFDIIKGKKGPQADNVDVV